MDSNGEDQKPKISINKAGLRAVAFASLVLSLALLAGLLAQGGLFTNDPGRPEHPDGLTTLALVLAVLAFLVQLFIFVIQTNASNAAVRRGEELNSQTQAVLGKIEAESTTTKEVLITQFNQLLDFVVDGGGGRQAPDSSQRQEARGADVKPVAEKESDSPLTGADLQRIINEALRPRERPHFDAALKATPSPEDEAIVEYLRAWPTKEEMEHVLAQLKDLPPFCLALLTRYGTVEIEQRSQGEPVGLYTGRQVPTLTRTLIDQGLLKLHGDRDRLALTERGRELARALPIGKASLEAPPWFDEVLTGSGIA